MGHYIAGTHTSWEQMKLSIAGIMNFNMFGIPLTGFDTCAYLISQINNELCGRWHQLTTFSPLARQYTSTVSQVDPYSLQEPFKSWAINALNDRLQYLRQMYTCMFVASLNGETCYDPVFLHYPDDSGAYDEPEHTFIAANVFKVSPVL
jgi:alpha-glucosidase (family GH31 glycosyl hydrolase)